MPTKYNRPKLEHTKLKYHSRERITMSCTKEDLDKLHTTPSNKIPQKVISNSRKNICEKKLKEDLFNYSGEVGKCSYKIIFHPRDEVTDSKHEARRSYDKNPDTVYIEVIENIMPNTTRDNTKTSLQQALNTTQRRSLLGAPSIRDRVNLFTEFSSSDEPKLSKKTKSKASKNKVIMELNNLINEIPILKDFMEADSKKDEKQGKEENEVIKEITLFNKKCEYTRVDYDSCTQTDKKNMFRIEIPLFCFEKKVYNSKNNFFASLMEILQIEQSEFFLLSFLKENLKDIIDGNEDRLRVLSVLVKQVYRSLLRISTETEPVLANLKKPGYEYYNEISLNTMSSRNLYFPLYASFSIPKTKQVSVQTTSKDNSESMRSTGNSSIASRLNKLITPRGNKESPSPSLKTRELYGSFTYLPSNLVNNKGNDRSDIEDNDESPPATTVNTSMSGINRQSISLITNPSPLPTPKDKGKKGNFGFFSSFFTTRGKGSRSNRSNTT